MPKITKNFDKLLLKFKNSARMVSHIVNSATSCWLTGVDVGSGVSLGVGSRIAADVASADSVASVSKPDVIIGFVTAEQEVLLGLAAKRHLLL